MVPQQCVCKQNAFNVTFQGGCNIFGRLLNLHSIEVIEKTKILQWNLVFFGKLELFPYNLKDLFNNVFRRADKYKVIHLVQEVYHDSMESGSIYRTVMYGSLKIDAWTA